MQDIKEQKIKWLNCLEKFSLNNKKLTVSDGANVTPEFDKIYIKTTKQVENLGSVCKQEILHHHKYYKYTDF